MVDEYVKKHAKLLVHYSVGVKKGDKVFIDGTSDASDLLLEIYREVLRTGAFADIFSLLPGQLHAKYAYSSDEVLGTEDQLDRFITASYDKYITLFNSHNVKDLATIDPERMARRSKSRKKIVELFNKREEKGELHWVGTLHPTEAYAQEASMSTEEYASFVYNACLLDKEDPVAEWKKISERQSKICDWLDKKDFIRVEGEGTELTLSTKGRKWINCDGKLNMPDGEVFTSPVEDSVEGKIEFNYPAIYRGHDVEGVKLSFKDGVLETFSASKGEAFLKAMVGTDEGSDKVGEIAVGTNYGINTFTKEILFDEKIGGTMHMALGDSIPSTGATNRSTIHWDMIKNMKDGGKIYADDEKFYENGSFIIDF